MRREAGQALCREGDPSSAVWFLRAGHVKLSKVALSGREVVLELRGPGDIVGEMGVIDGGARSASVIALGHAELLSLTPAAFFEVVDRRPPIARRLLEELVGRLRQAADRQLEIGTADVVGRLAQRLVELAGSLGVEQDAKADSGAPRRGSSSPRGSPNRIWPTGAARRATASCGRCATCAAPAWWTAGGPGCGSGTSLRSRRSPPAVEPAHRWTERVSPSGQRGQSAHGPVRIRNPSVGPVVEPSAAVVAAKCTSPWAYLNRPVPPVTMQSTRPTPSAATLSSSSQWI